MVASASTPESVRGCQRPLRPGRRRKGRIGKARLDEGAHVIRFADGACSACKMPEAEQGVAAHIWMRMPRKLAADALGIAGMLRLRRVQRERDGDVEKLGRVVAGEGGGDGGDGGRRDLRGPKDV